MIDGIPLSISHWTYDWHYHPLLTFTYDSEVQLRRFQAAHIVQLKNMQKAVPVISPQTALNVFISDYSGAIHFTPTIVYDMKLEYVLLGDPAIRLHYPTDYRIRTEQVADTLNALTLHEFAGWVESAEGDTAREFNGVVNITMMDKLQQITTLDNDQPDPSKKTTHTYNDYPNTLFRGSARVENGHFRYSFMVPKDIRYNFGNGRIVASRRRDVIAKLFNSVNAIRDADAETRRFNH